MDTYLKLEHHCTSCLSSFFLVCSSEFYPASPMDNLLSTVYLISSEWDMLQCVQFPTVVGFVDIQSCVWEKTMREQNKNKNKNKIIPTYK